MTAITASEVARTPRARTCGTSDHDLVAAVRCGDDAAFERLYERYSRRVAYYVYGMVHDYGRAEDIAQDVFMSALRRMRQTDRPISFKPWIYEIAKNACIDQFRRTQRRIEVSYEVEDAVGSPSLTRLPQTCPTPEQAVDQKMSLDDLRGAFGSLSETHHQILVMRELEGLSYDEIGERLQMTRPAVESTLFRARRRLAEEYEEIVTGERCLKVQAVVDAAAEGALGARDRRKLAAHMSHCQRCRRHAYAAGIDVAVVGGRVRAKVAALLPFPLLLRRRAPGSSDIVAAGSNHGSGLVGWASQVGSVLDPSVASWARAAAAAATVAVAGISAGEGGEQLVATMAPGAGAGNTPIVRTVGVSSAAPASHVVRSKSRTWTVSGAGDASVPPPRSEPPAPPRPAKPAGTGGAVVKPVAVVAPLHLLPDYTGPGAGTVTPPPFSRVAHSATRRSIRDAIRKAVRETQASTDAIEQDGRQVVDQVKGLLDHG